MLHLKYVRVVPVFIMNGIFPLNFTTLDFIRDIFAQNYSVNYTQIIPCC